MEKQTQLLPNEPKRARKNKNKQCAICGRPETEEVSGCNLCKNCIDAFLTEFMNIECSESNFGVFVRTKVLEARA